MIFCRQDSRTDRVLDSDLYFSYNNKYPSNHQPFLAEVAMFNFFLRSRLEQLASDASADSTYYLQAFQLEYLLKELEFQVAFEGHARDRAEQMVSYLLTTIAAILGAVLLIVQNEAYYLLVAFIAAFLIWMFSAFAFYRVCRLRNAITHARLNRRLIRRSLEQIGLKQAASIVAIEGPPSGFSLRLVINVNIIGAISSLAGGLCLALGWALFLIDLVQWPGAVLDHRWLNFVVPFLIGFLGITIVLVLVYRAYYFNSEHLIAKLLPSIETQVV